MTDHPTTRDETGPREPDWYPCPCCEGAGGWTYPGVDCCAEARALEAERVGDALHVLLGAIDAAIDVVADHHREHQNVPYQVAEAMQRLSQRAERARALLAIAREYAALGPSEREP